MNALLDPSLAALSEENADLRRQVQLATNALERANAMTASLRERLRICREALEGLNRLSLGVYVKHLGYVCASCEEVLDDEAEGHASGCTVAEAKARAALALAESK